MKNPISKFLDGYGIDTYNPLDFEWDNGMKLRVIEILGGMALYLGFAFLLFSPVVDTTTRWNIMGYLAMFVLATVIWGVDVANEKNPVVESVGFGHSWKNALFGAVLGVALFGGIIAVKMLKLAVIQIPTYAAVSGNTFLWIGIVAPFTEEMTWRAMLNPTIAKLMTAYVPYRMAALIGFTVGNLIFAGFHYWVYGWSLPVLAFIFAMGMLFSLGNSYLHTTTFGYAGHTVFNIGTLMVA